MKKIIFTLVLFVAMISFSAQAESPCRPYLILNGIQYSWMTTYVSISINQGDTLICSVAEGSPCGFCAIDSAITNWTFHGITTYVVTIAATDTGTYTLYAHPASTSCGLGDDGTFYVTVNYSTTSVAELVSSNGIEVSPTLSSGIFKIKTADKNLKQLRISDSAGRIVYTSENNFSEINLSNFSSGIYFYALTDEKENVWRGRIVKE